MTDPQSPYIHLIEGLIPDDATILVVPDAVKPEVDRIIAGWKFIHGAEEALKELHDQVCGRGVHVHESGKVIDSDAYHGICEDLARSLGQIILELVAKS